LRFPALLIDRFFWFLLTLDCFPLCYGTILFFSIKFDVIDSCSYVWCNRTATMPMDLIYVMLLVVFAPALCHAAVRHYMRFYSVVAACMITLMVYWELTTQWHLMKASGQDDSTKWYWLVGSMCSVTFFSSVIAPLSLCCSTSGTTSVPKVHISQIFSLGRILYGSLGLYYFVAMAVLSDGSTKWETLSNLTSIEDTIGLSVDKTCDLASNTNICGRDYILASGVHLFIAHMSIYGNNH